MDADTDRIDVVIPVRGNPAWLRLSLESMASQSVLPNAVWVVDDGLELKAGTVDLGKRCLGQRFRLLKSAAQGISAALNTAIRQSSAEWIARMDSDDVAHPQRLQRQLEFLKAQADGTIGCGTQARFINGDGDVLDRSRLPTTWQDIVKQIHCTTSFIHPTLLIRRDALLATPYRSQMDGAEDVDLILRLAEKNKILNLQTKRYLTIALTRPSRAFAPGPDKPLFKSWHFVSHGSGGKPRWIRSRSSLSLPKLLCSGVYRIPRMSILAICLRRCGI